MIKEWNLKEVYPSNKEIEKDKEFIYSKIEELKKFQGRLNNAEDVAAFFTLEKETEQVLEKLFACLSMNFDLNQKDLNAQMEMGKLQPLYMAYVSALSFVDEEIIKNKYEDFVEWSKKHEIIKEYLFSIRKTFDGASHVLTAKEEAIIANYSTVTGAFSSLYAMLENSDNKTLNVETSEGTLAINKNNYTYYLGTLKSQEDRKKIFEALFEHYETHKNTFAAIYKGVIDKDIAMMKNRHYKTILETFLDHNKIPESVYLSLIETVRKHTEPLKEWIRLRKDFFHLKEYHTYDRILTMAHSDVKYDYEEAYNTVLKVLEVMGEDFVNHAKIAMKEEHVDVYPRDGKRSGAYSSQIQGYGPYILLNHTDDLNSLFTLIHECGHSIHTLYSLENQPYATKDYVIFVAEIASTFNEQLLLDYLLKNSDDKTLKIQALEQQIDSIVSTFYRQTLFADFEYQAHLKALNGEGLTYETLCNIMKELYLEYYGIDLETEPLKKFVWAYIPHLFNSPFYVYQYATCLSAAMEIYQNVKNNVPGAKEKYIEMLKLGGSMYPVDIVKKGGVDLTTSKPFEAVCNKLSELVKTMKELIK